MSEWLHIGIGIVDAFIGSGVIVYIWSNKRQAKEENERRHLENVTRLTKIETMLDPIWKWWNKTNGEH